MNRAALIGQIQQAKETLEKLLALLESVPVERGPIRFLPLSVPPGASPDVRNCQKVEQANRAVRHRELPGCGEYGL
jgi:hypothetical protein